MDSWKGGSKARQVGTHRALAAAGLGTLGSDTILLVDDDPAVRAFTGQVLTGAGFRVLTASNGAKALLLGQSIRIDLLLADIEMPVIRGPELAERLAASHPETKVLFVSGGSPTLGSSGLPASASFLPKPYTAASLLLRVRQILHPEADSLHGH